MKTNTNRKSLNSRDSIGQKTVCATNLERNLEVRWKLICAVSLFVINKPKDEAENATLPLLWFLT